MLNPKGYTRVIAEQTFSAEKVYGRLEAQ